MSTHRNSFIKSKKFFIRAKDAIPFFDVLKLPKNEIWGTTALLYFWFPFLKGGGLWLKLTQKKYELIPFWKDGKKKFVKWNLGYFAFLGLFKLLRTSFFLSKILWILGHSDLIFFPKEKETFWLWNKVRSMVNEIIKKRTKSDFKENGSSFLYYIKLC